MKMIKYTFHKMAMFLASFASLALGISWSWEGGPLSYQPLAGGFLIIAGLYVFAYTLVESIKKAKES